MTGKGRCVQDDRGKECCVRNGEIDLLFRFKTLCVSDGNRTYL